MLLPMKRVQRARKVVDEMDRNARAIFESKKRALEQGDEAVLQQVGEGKDIMSRLCGFTIISCSLLHQCLLPPSVVQANMSASEDEKLSEEDLVGQIS